MDIQIIATFCICADILKGLRHQEDAQSQLSDTEVLTAAIVAAMFFAGNQAATCQMLKEQGYMPQMLSRSRFNRRLHRIRELVLVVFAALAEYWAVCDNIRIPRAKIYHDEAYRGYCANKKRYFYGVKVHLVVTQDGQPVEVYLTPGSTADVTLLPDLLLDLPADSGIYANRAYTDYAFEDDFKDVDGQQGNQFLPMRKANSKRSVPPWQRYLQHTHRKIVETTASLVSQLFPKSIHAVTAAGFELKVILFVWPPAFALFR